MAYEEGLTRKERLSGLMRKLYLDPKTRAVMTGLSGGLGATGNTALAGTGAVVSMFDTFLAAQLSRVEANHERLAELTDAGMEVLYDAGLFDENIFQDKHFQGLVFQAAVAAAQETEDEKLRWYAAILAGAASREKPEQMNLRALLSSMTFLTAQEMRLAREFYEGFTLEQHGYAILDGVSTPLWGPDTSLYLRRLESADLIAQRSDVGPFARNVGPNGSYFTTSTFQRLMELVKQTEPPSQNAAPDPAI